LENLQKTFQHFSENLDIRFTNEVYTTEDSVRYTFFQSLTSIMNLSLEEIILEFPHPVIKRAEIDMLIPPKEGRNELVFEFKFDREMPSGHNSPRPMKAGKLFADLVRLSKYKEKHGKSKCFFVYVTDYEMADYMNKDSNRLNDFFNLPQNEILKINDVYINNHSDTFVSQALTYGTHNIDVSLSHFANLNKTFYVRIYEIDP
jgi:hypothetical protein